MYRHAPRWLRAVDLVRQGALGDPRLVKVVFAFAIPTDLANIRFIPEAGGGIIWDMGCYAANMARGIWARSRVEVFAYGEVRAGQATETSVSGVMHFPEGRAAPFAASFDYANPFAQVEVVGTDGWLALPGTGFRREPYVKLLLHTGGELYVHNREPKVEVFAFDDPYAREVEHLSGAIRGEHPLAWDLADAAANTAVLRGHALVGPPQRAGGGGGPGLSGSGPYPALVVEQPGLAVEPSAVTGQGAVGAYDPVAGHDDGDGVAPVGQPHCPAGLDVADVARPAGRSSRSRRTGSGAGRPRLGAGSRCPPPAAARRNPSGRRRNRPPAGRPRP